MDTNEQITEDQRPKTQDPLWLVGCFVITSVAAFLRFWQLELKPLHHDEGVNGFFLTTLFREGVYKYDPTNYHGPDLYYIALAATKMFGLNTLSIRGSVAVFGLLTVVLAFFLKNYVGRTGSLVAALFLALSPGMVYISRYFIHEILFVFFSFGIVVGVLYFVERRRVGAIAIAAMTVLLLVCFLPTALNMANFVGKENATLVWAIRVAAFAVEAVLVFLIMRMLLAWNDGRPIYLLLAAASAILLFATKETAFITVATLAIAAVCVWLWRKIYANAFFEEKKIGIVVFAHVVLLIAAAIYRAELVEGAKWIYENFLGAGNQYQPFVFCSIVFLAAISLLVWVIFLRGVFRENETGLVEPVALTWTTLRERVGNSTDLLLITVAVVFIFAYVGILFFSSFFTYPEGVKKAFEAYAVWTKTGSKDHTQNGTLAYVRWLLKIESPILILSALGSLIAFLKARHRFALFAGLWAFGLFAAYTIIPYKTPWLALSFTLPMCIVAGYGINELLASRNVLLKFGGAVLLTGATVVLGYQTYDLNFRKYDDDSMPYVYAHTRRGFLDLIKQIEFYADKSGKGKDASIEVVSPDYWSMPWYMRDYPKAFFHGNLVDASTSEMIVASEAQSGELNERYGAHYKSVGKYPLRPGVELYLLVRRDLADAGAEELYKLDE